MKKMDYIGLLFSLLLLLYLIAIAVTYKSEYDVYRYIINHAVLDLTFGITGMLGIIAGPLLLIISYVKKRKSGTEIIKSITPLIAGLMMFLIMSAVWVIFFKHFSLRLFWIPGLYLILCLITVFYTKNMRKKSE
ncbi:MAG: hypothetical protein JW982_16940 [Spirochaetes bacterium]|nr:hypothetical protein [Spirochaetota bacterium]